MHRIITQTELRNIILGESSTSSRLWLMVAFVGSSPYDIIPKESFNKMDDIRVITNLSENAVKIGATSARGVSQLWDASKGKVRHLDTLHAKVYLFESTAVVTSANLSTRAFNHKIEIGIHLNERNLMKRLEDIFDKYWKIGEVVSKEKLNKLQQIERRISRDRVPPILDETSEELHKPSLDDKSTAILVNITWNSKEWRKPSKDPSNFKWVRERKGTPHESWNFNFNNKWSTDKVIRGFFETKVLPLKSIDCVFFNSRNTYNNTDYIVGVYGGTKVVPYQGDYEWNIEGEKSISVAFHPKAYLNVNKARYFPYNKKRIGRVNFLYLSKNNVASIVEDALNSHRRLRKSIASEYVEKLERLKIWLGI